ncbi:hypothetical protein VMHJH2_00205 [Streptococcus uberis]|uniref:hypothetical protein n=1 Tax=Streptococcus uberis TaxID=1349 RepID=UPI00214F6CED|nr:hypothetical protein [Streptococcus uberis]MCR4256934.1 hypothetical protein [Streptococcus uberis]
MAYRKRKYNSYRKRSFVMSDTKRREYAQSMEKLDEEIEKLDWSLSSKKDSCYKWFDNYQVRLSNHSADNKYHDLEEGFLIINIKASKLNFANIIQNDLEKILKVVDEQDLTQFRFINVTGVDGNVNFFYKGFKTKKMTISLR